MLRVLNAASCIKRGRAVSEYIASHCNGCGHRVAYSESRVCNDAVMQVHGICRGQVLEIGQVEAAPCLLRDHAP